MYSWMASWFNGEESQADETLYVENADKDKNTQAEQWTWIEVIKENDTGDGLIYIQSTEEQRNKMIAGPVKAKKKPKRRSEIKAANAFKNSLYLDIPLFVEPPKVKPLKRLKSFPVSLRALCKKNLSVTEVLSSTFPCEESTFLPFSSDHDWTSMMQKAVLLKNFMNIAIRSDRIQFENGIETWLNALLYKPLPSIEAKKALLAIEWRKPYLSIEWRKNDNITEDGDNCKIIEAAHLVPKWMSRIDVVDHFEKSPPNDDVIDEDDLKIIEVRYHIPKWMSRLEVVEQYNKLPPWIKKIDATLFDDHQNPSIKNEVGIIQWMQEIDIFEDCQHRVRKEQIKVPSWIKKIDLFDESEINAVPSWMQHIEVSEDENQDNINMLASWMTQIDVFREEIPDDVYQTYQWMDIMGSAPYIDRSAPKVWFGNLSDVKVDQQWCNPRPVLKKVCQSMMNVAALIAACDVCATSTTLIPNQACNRVSSEIIKRKHFSNTNTIDLGKKKRSTMKKNKKWLRRQNSVNTFSMRKRKYAPTHFSGQGGVRGGVRAC